MVAKSVVYGETFLSGQGKDTWCDSNISISNSWYKDGSSYLDCNAGGPLYYTTVLYYNIQKLAGGGAQVDVPPTGRSDGFVCAEKNFI